MPLATANNIATHPSQDQHGLQENKNGIEQVPTLKMFTDLPRELKQRVASFLTYSDLMNLVAASRSIRSDLDLEIKSSPLTDRFSQNKHYQTSFRGKVFAVVVPKPESRIHSMTFHCHIQSRVHGRVWIVEQDVPSNRDPESLKRGRFADGNVVVMSKPFDSIGKFALSFPVRPSKMYQFHIMTQGWGRSAHFVGMRLDRVGFGRKSTEYISYQFDAFERYEEEELAICR